MSNLNDDQRDFFAAMENTLHSPGWQMMTNRWTEERDQLKESAFYNAESMEDMIAARERYGILEELITLPEKISQQKLAAETGE